MNPWHGVRLGAICLVLACASAAAAADFATVGSSSFRWEGIFASGRLSALGGSDLTDRSPATLLINPAPLDTRAGLELGFDHADYISGTEFRTYAGAVAWNGVRLNVAVQDFTIDSSNVRTAYLPEGTGETFDIRDRMAVVGLSYELAPVLFDERSVRLSVGAAWRRYSAVFDDTEGSADALDLGSTLSWRTDYRDGWTGLSAAVSWQNATDATYTFGDYQTRLPRPLRTGLTVESAVKRAGSSRDLVKFLVAYTRSFEVSDSAGNDSDHFGAETLFLNALALRYGHSTRVNDDIESWGVGIVLDRRLLRPFAVELNLGEMSYDNPLLGGKRTIWGARARYDF